MSIPDPETPATYEPTTILAGDSVKWTKSLADYKAGEGWSLTYTLNGPSLISITSSADGDDHAVTVTPATSADYKPGVYSWAARASDGTDAYTVATGSLEIKPDPTTITTTDARTHAAIVLEKVEAVIEDRASHDVASYTIGGRQLNRMGAEELLKLRSKYRAEVAAEHDAERRRRGLKSRRQIGVRF